MAKDVTRPADPNQPTEPVVRRPADAIWFAVLALSVATGIGMTMFAPVGDDPPVSSTGAILPATDASPTTGPSTSPATAPLS